jgi:uncharacterized protein YjeT (DUF2065 family)
MFIFIPPPDLPPNATKKEYDERIKYFNQLLWVIGITSIVVGIIVVLC